MTSVSTIEPSALAIDGRGMPTLNSEHSLSKRSYSSIDTDTSDGISPSKQRRPMRKRAKTQEEKEERAQERIMRNRAAAQVSRERKREHMATLEVENEQLLQRISSLTTDNEELRTNMTTLTQRLENLEKMLAYFTTPTSLPIEQSTQFTCPTPPGTIRPQDLQSVTSTPVLESIDSRNPAASNFDEISMDPFFTITDVQADGNDSFVLDSCASSNEFTNFYSTNNDLSQISMYSFPEAILA